MGDKTRAVSVQIHENSRFEPDQIYKMRLCAIETTLLQIQSILFHWPVIGWHIGTIQRRVFDGRTKRCGQHCNFFIHYEVDDDEVPTVLELASYDGADEGCWVLLQSIA